MNASSEPNSPDLSEAQGDASGADKENKVNGKTKVDGEASENGGSEAKLESKPEGQDIPDKQGKAEPQNGAGSKQEEDLLDEYMKEKIEECQASLDRAAGWESFVLDARSGMKVQTGIETLRWYRRRMGWA